MSSLQSLANAPNLVEHYNGRLENKKKYLLTKIIMQSVTLKFVFYYSLYLT
jgi:hypothetical protein